MDQLSLVEFGSLCWGEDLNVIFYQNMPNLHNWYKSAERKISQKNHEEMLKYSDAVEDWVDIDLK